MKFLAWGLGLWLACAAAGLHAESACPPTVAAGAGGGAGGGAAASAPAKDRGLMWRITRDGRTSWLFGTLHVGKPAWRRLGPQVSAALKSSDVLALEIDPSDPALMKALSEVLPPASLPEPVARRLARAFERACVASESLATMHPVLQATTLTVLEARWLGMDSTYAMENLLLAQMRGRRVLSLETAAQQKAALVPDDPAEAMSVLEQTLAQLEDQSSRRVLSRMAQAWEAGDLAALEDYERWCECISNDSDRASMRKLNDERNPQLADGIEAQHRQGRRVFAAVGALHMTGEQSLPRLLAQRGFKVERIAFGP